MTEWSPAGLGGSAPNSEAIRSTRGWRGSSHPRGLVLASRFRLTRLAAHERRGPKGRVITPSRPSRDGMKNCLLPGHRAPEIDVAFDRVLVNATELLVVEREVREGAQILIELLDATGANHERGHAFVAQCPRKR